MNELKRKHLNVKGCDILAIRLKEDFLHNSTIEDLLLIGEQINKELDKKINEIEKKIGDIE